MLNAEAYTPTDAGAIPTGEIAPVKGTPFDFTNSQTNRSRYQKDHEQIKFGMGFDHNFVIKRPAGDKSLILAARVHEPKSGRVMEVLTTEPGIQFYCGKLFGWTAQRQSGKAYVQRGGFCLETQHYPDSPISPSFLRRFSSLARSTKRAPFTSFPSSKTRLFQEAAFSSLCSLQWLSPASLSSEQISMLICSMVPPAESLRTCKAICPKRTTWFSSWAFSSKRLSMARRASDRHRHPWRYHRPLPTRAPSSKLATGTRADRVTVRWCRRRGSRRCDRRSVAFGLEHQDHMVTRLNGRVALWRNDLVVASNQSDDHPPAKLTRAPVVQPRATRRLPYSPRCRCRCCAAN